MLRKIMIFTCSFSTIISAISLYTKDDNDWDLFIYYSEWGFQLDWIQIGFVALAVSSFSWLFFTMLKTTLENQ